MDRVAARFDPRGGLDDLHGRRNRIRAQRRIGTGALALTVAAGGSLLAGRAFFSSTPRPSSTVKIAATWPATSAATRTAPAAGRSDCPPPSGDSPPHVVFSSHSGLPGSVVEVSGRFENGELWLQLWWNADWDKIPDRVDPPPWPPTGPDLRFGSAGPGPVIELASVAGPAAAGDCTFRSAFTVPDVSAGTYQVLWAIGAANPPLGEKGYALLVSPTTFEVTG
jgi:hypothetical protein